MKLHLDTDIGSDPDDACALAMVLGWPTTELTGITTVIDPAGRRAGYARRILELAGQAHVPVVAGAEVSLTSTTMPGTIGDDERYWGGPVPPAPSPAGAALDLLEASIDAGATVAAIGPFTNLGLLAVSRPASLGRARVVIMGGWLEPPPPGYPEWGPEADWNVQCDTLAAELLVRAAGEITMVPLATTAQVHLRASHLGRLEAAGALGRLLARQARAYASDRPRAGLARQHQRLPDDLLNFHHDPLACAVALGWSGAKLKTLPSVRAVNDGAVLRFDRGAGGRPLVVVSDVDGEAFSEEWIARVESASGDGVS
jgi:purine nucleosidase